MSSLSPLLGIQIRRAEVAASDLRRARQIVQGAEIQVGRQRGALAQLIEERRMLGHVQDERIQARGGCKLDIEEVQFILKKKGEQVAQARAELTECLRTLERVREDEAVAAECFKAQERTREKYSAVVDMQNLEAEHEAERWQEALLEDHRQKSTTVME
ncbi:MAG: hypothetical protein Q7T63_01875 [Burkholderiaceae bacterium]|nr:hypothetical protein [Burkholderiaceae bacterium]